VQVFLGYHKAVGKKEYPECGKPGPVTGEVENLAALGGDSSERAGHTCRDE
jgi:hypothetical protein